MDSAPKIIYLADVRMPTEKAHGWQIVKMCEAFAELGVRVELRVPRRKQFGQVSLDPFEYYGVKRIFSVRRVANVDVVAMEPRLPPMLSEPLLRTHAAAWETAAVASLVRSKPDLVYTRDLGVAAACAVLNLPSVYEVHASPGVRAGALLRRLTARHEPRKVVCLTPFIRDSYTGLGYAPDRVVVEGDSVDPAPYENPPTKVQARSRIGIPRTAKVIGFAGTFTALEEERGLDLLIDAVARLGDDVRLVLVGGPMEAEAKLRGWARSHGLPHERLMVHDRVPNAEVPTWLRAFDAVVMPYPDTPHYALDLSPLKLFEAMVAGVPMVSTDLPSARLVLRHRENGLLVPPADPQALADALSELLAEPLLRRRLAARARTDVASNTWAARATRILASAGIAT